jgi:hypothetical protein
MAALMRRATAAAGVADIIAYVRTVPPRQWHRI